MLKISARGEYALLLVRYLLRTSEIRTIAQTAREIAISESLIRKIANDLEHAEILRSVKGRNGGILIAKQEISVYEVLAAVGEDLALTVCTGNALCALSTDCTLSPLIRNLQR